MINLLNAKLNKIVFIFFSIIIFPLISSCKQPSSFYNGESGYIITLSTQNQLLQDKLTTDARNFLTSIDESSEFDKNPKNTIKRCINKVIPGMYGRLKNNICPKSYKILAELCIYAARNDRSENNIKYWMSACMYSYRYLFNNPEMNNLPLSPESGIVISYYNFSIIKIFSYIKQHNYINRSRFSIPSIIGKVNFIYPQSDLPWKLHSFEDFFIGYNYKDKNFNETTIQTGIGIPLGGLPFKDDYFQEILDHVKIIKYMYPCTFILKFNFGTTDTAIPCYFDYYKNTYIEINGQKVITPNAYSIITGIFLEKYPQKITANYFFNPEKIINDKMGIYMLTDYDKDKIPVVFIHGLISNPQSYGQMINTLMQSQTIRENFQFWFLYYPTSQPIILDASDLRTILKNIDKQLNFYNKSSKFNDMVLVGYSLGGLVAQLCIQGSNGNYFKERVIENNKKTANSESKTEVINSLDKVLRFEALPFVKNVIFISTPHKGAEMASWSLFQLIANLLTANPKDYNRNLEIISELRIKYNDQITSANALYNLMPNSSFIKLIQTLPFNKNTKLYSIISDKNGPDDPAGTDGIVTYDSAYLKNATEDIIIKSNHHSLILPSCAREVLKILLKTLSENEK